MKFKDLLIIGLLIGVPFPAMAQLEYPGDFRTFSFYFENDAFAHTDRHYTSGIRLSWISRDMWDYRENYPFGQWGYPFIKKLPFVNTPGDQRAIYMSLGQNIYTPNDIDRTDLIEDDRPYAGFTYLAIGFQSKDSRLMNTLEFNLGMVGPHSYAEDSQRVVHKWIGSGKAKGWDHQLKDEPAFEVIYLRKTKLLQWRLDRHLGFDLIPHLGGGLGNIQTYASAGGQVRFGWNLPNDFGTFLIRPGCECNVAIDRLDPRFFRHQRFGIHIFAAVDAYAVLRDIFLDGNTFRESHSVEKKIFTAEFLTGIGLIVGRFKISYAFVYQTKKFKNQEEEDIFGTITISVSY